MRNATRKQLVDSVKLLMEIEIGRGYRDIDRLFRDTVGTMDSRYRAEIDRLGDGQRTWARFENECIKAAQKCLAEELWQEQYRAQKSI